MNFGIAFGALAIFLVLNLNCDFELEFDGEIRFDFRFGLWQLRVATHRGVAWDYPSELDVASFCRKGASSRMVAQERTTVKSR